MINEHDVSISKSYPSALLMLLMRLISSEQPNSRNSYTHAKIEEKTKKQKLETLSQNRWTSGDSKMVGQFRLGCVGPQPDKAWVPNGCIPLILPHST